MIAISDIEHHYEKEVEERPRIESVEELSVKKKEPRSKLKVLGLILNSIGGILYLLTVFMVVQTETGSNYPAASMPFIIAGVISLMGTITGAKDIKMGSMMILLSLPVTFLIGVIFSPYWHFYLYFIAFVFRPIPLPHSVFVIIGGILCLLSSNRKIN